VHTRPGNRPCGWSFGKSAYGAFSASVLGDVTAMGKDQNVRIYGDHPPRPS
jgi:hypothetical protein